MCTLLNCEPCEPQLATSCQKARNWSLVIEKTVRSSKLEHSDSCDSKFQAVAKHMQGLSANINRFYQSYRCWSWKEETVSAWVQIQIRTTYLKAYLFSDHQLQSILDIKSSFPVSPIQHIFKLPSRCFLGLCRPFCHNLAARESIETCHT